MIRKVSKKQKIKNEEKKLKTIALHKLFLEIWDEREDPSGSCYCFETGQELKGSIFRQNTCCYDHVLEKSKYPEYEFLKSNIIILHPDVHNSKGNNIDSTPKVRKYRDYLLSLHYENKLK